MKGDQSSTQPGPREDTLTNTLTHTELAFTRYELNANTGLLVRGPALLMTEDRVIGPAGVNTVQTTPWTH